MNGTEALTLQVPVPRIYGCGHHQCLRNYIGTSAFADVSYLIADVEAKFYV